MFLFLSRAGKRLCGHLSHLDTLSIVLASSAFVQAALRGRYKRFGFDTWVGKIPWKRAWQSSILAWKIPWTEEPGGLQSTDHRVRHS